jgi:hypothetical protein
MADEASNYTLQYLQELPATQFSAEEIEILGRVNQKIAGARDLDHTLQYLFEATREITHCDRVSIAFLDDEQQRVFCHTAKADYEPLRLGPGYSEDLQGSSLEEVIHAGRCRLIGDLEEYARHHPDSRSTKLLLAEGVRSNMTCPLKVEDRIVGLLFRSSRQPSSFTPHQVRIHLAINERLSQAIEKAWRIEKLAQANRDYMEILSFVTHELKSPIATTVMTMELLRDGHFGPVTDQQRDKLSKMEYNMQYLLLLIRDYLNLARIEGGGLKLSPRRGVDVLAEVIDPAVEMLEPWLDGKGMRLEKNYCEAICPIDCDPALLSIALTNLLNNAAKYGRKGGTIRLDVDCSDGLSCRVWNEGPGFSPQDREKLFRKFSRLKDRDLKKARGTGVGLYTVWRIITRHGGQITADSEKGSWAEFRFRIPQPLSQDTWDRAEPHPPSDQ